MASQIQSQPDTVCSSLQKVLDPVVFFPWGGLALRYLGIQIDFDTHMIAIRDEDYDIANQKLKAAGYATATPDRRRVFDLMNEDPTPVEVVRRFNADNERIDLLSTMFTYPAEDPSIGAKLVLIQNSFACLPLHGSPSTPTPANPGPSVDTEKYDTHGTIIYPLEQVLLESFVRAAIDEEFEMGNSTWLVLLKTWITIMIRHLPVDKTILDDCADHTIPDWYRGQFGRMFDANGGEG
ncbi:hypothetical protein N7462_010479 [Penicillium macrosclerotiorum]|uniref:uncharacterized protein n=1 Tax=Penicillium macrosclerotiorum TaxID=303699 RepID=UPI002546736B|nr:uncharacterized protein N7462_010479 [Penicillium macrosclerotiorum]KAJ5669409.1 hypothetical protein N7462_010479 [Penicillium macrosclerotiorum]